MIQYVAVVLVGLAVLGGISVGRDERTSSLVQSRLLGHDNRSACECSFSLSETTVTEHEPIVVKFSFTNHDSYPVDLKLGYNREGGFVLTLKKPDGTILELPRRRAKEGLALIGSFALGPQAIYSQQLILNEWFDFAQPGTYELRASLKNSPRTQDGDPIACENKRMVFTVEPLDVKRLQQTCRNLLEVIGRNVSNYANAADAARALVTVRHPVAVSFLQSAMEVNPRVDDLIISGLEQIGNAEAICVLIRVLEHSDYDSAEFVDARAALVKLEKKTADPISVEKIRIALAKVTP
jgi:hypothetical protein